VIKSERRAFCVDFDTVYVDFVYDEKFDVWLGNFPCFDEEPRITKNGRLWKNVSSTDCPYAPPQYLDCGTCSYLKKQDPKDMIGVCFNEKLQLKADDSSKEENL